jgi:hypothetical protein
MVGGGRLLRGLGHLAGKGEAVIGQAVWIAGAGCVLSRVLHAHAFNITFVRVVVLRREVFWKLHVQCSGLRGWALLVTPLEEYDWSDYLILVLIWSVSAKMQFMTTHTL